MLVCVVLGCGMADGVSGAGRAEGGASRRLQDVKRRTGRERRARERRPDTGKAFCVPRSKATWGKKDLDLEKFAQLGSIMTGRARDVAGAEKVDLDLDLRVEKFARDLAYLTVVGRNMLSASWKATVTSLDYSATCIHRIWELTVSQRYSKSGLEYADPSQPYSKSGMNMEPQHLQLRQGRVVDARAQELSERASGWPAPPRHV